MRILFLTFSGSTEYSVMLQGIALIFPAEGYYHRPRVPKDAVMPEPAAPIALTESVGAPLQPKAISEFPPAVENHSSSSVGGSGPVTVVVVVIITLNVPGADGVPVQDCGESGEGPSPL